MLKWGFLIVTGLMLLACGTPSAELPATRMVTLGRWTRPVFDVHEPLEVAYERDQELLFFLGNPSETQTRIVFEGASMETKEIPAESWVSVNLRMRQRRLRVIPSNGPIYMSKPYLLPRTPSEKTNVLLVCVDTLRADFFSPQHMPEVWALFQQGTIFPRAYSPVPWTLPAHASLFTSTYPVTHGVRLPEHCLDQSHVTLAERFAEEGYATIGITEGNYVSSLYHLNQGFDGYYEDYPDISSDDVEMASKLEANIDEFQHQLELMGNLPKFAFFHTYEVHCPYFPRGELTDPKGVGRTAQLLEMDGKTLDAQVVEKLRQLYASEVRYCDEMLAGLFRKLTAAGDWIVVLLSDHGEEFGEHGGLLHADTLFEEAVHIPLAMMGPGVNAELMDPRVCSLIDVAPTITDILGIQAPSTWQGVPLSRAASSMPELFFESFFFGPHIPAENPRLSGILFEGLKFVEEQNFGHFRNWLFDLERDPFETQDRCADLKSTCDQYGGRLETYWQFPGIEAPTLEEISQQQSENLRGLGYLQ